ncbi:RING finger domain and kelch repeat-containing protein DDB_G0271372 [Aplysia californica]|uniref:RING finger domain and kelch repeat-containing protein DDB_G0271372 n=1 Tax=Aplysia californica TaxID=6500 RepID=A0ABM0K5G1_APLCA|nr:RING finger domain and kelch repeat-containing protein DDB_G0271372 [Aplysia californica]
MEMIKDLTCPICLEFFAHPIILPCSHVLCRRPCAENLFDVNFIRCPVCRDNCYISGGISSLPRVIALESIIETVRAERKARTTGTSAANHDNPSSHKVSDNTSTNKSPPYFLSTSTSSVSSSVSPDQLSSRSTPELATPSSVIAPPLSQHRLLPPVPTVSLEDMLARTAAYSSNRQRVSPPADFSSERNNSEHSVGNNSTQPLLPLRFEQGTQSENRIQTEDGEQLFRTITRPALPSELANQNLQDCSIAPRSFEQTQIRSSHITRSLVSRPSASCTTFQVPHPDLESVNGIISGADRSVSTTQESCTSVDTGPVKREIQEQLQRLCDAQCQLLLHLTSYKDKADLLQDTLSRRRTNIDSQFDSLVAALEDSRNRFLEHVDEDSKRHQVEIDSVTVATEKLLTSTQELACFAEQILESTQDVMMETAPAILDSLALSVKDCQLCLLAAEPRFRTTMTHRIDLRNEKEILRNIDYLKAPSRPVLQVDKCTRNTDLVALVLAPPPPGDVIECYEITYCSEDQKRLGIEERYYATLSLDAPNPTPSTNNDGQVVVIDNLCRMTHYYFSACALNAEGRSQSSEFVQCMTIGQQETVVPVPVILENQCQTGNTSAVVCCPSTTAVTACQGVAHFLLYRPGGGAGVWHRRELSANEEKHSATRLRPGTEYDFAVMACNSRGECQMSEKVVLETKQ